MSRVFQAAQAEKGKDVYALACLSCHKPVEHSGKFWETVVGRTLGEFFTYIRREMPQDNPASLSDDDYVNVTAYMLQLNAMPSGDRPLTADTTVLAKIRIVPLDTSRKGPGR